MTVAPQAARPTLVVADGSPDDLQLVARVLERRFGADYAVITASSADEPVPGADRRPLARPALAGGHGRHGDGPATHRPR